MLRSLVAWLLLPSTLFAAELTPLRPAIHYLGSEIIAYVVFTQTPAGFLVIATLELGAETGPLVLRFNAVLLPGQSTEIVAPQELGRPPAVLRILRDGDTLRLEPDPSLASLR